MNTKWMEVGNITNESFDPSFNPSWRLQRNKQMLRDPASMGVSSQRLSLTLVASPPPAPASRLPGTLRRLSAVVKEFFSVSSMHGARYLVEEGAHWLERVLWAFSIILSIFGASWLIATVLTKYRTTPIITSVESTNYPVWKIPFPAITICNVNKVVRSTAYKFYKQELLQSEVGEKKFIKFSKRLAELIQPQDINESEMNEMETMRQNYNITIDMLMKKMAQPCESLLSACRWRGKITACSKLFDQQLTDAGYCCSFNHRAPGKNRQRDVKYVTGAGYMTGLSLLLDPQLHEYFSWLFSFQGMQVLVHGTYNYPDVSARGLVLASDRESFLQISAESTYTVEELRTLTPDQRECLFEDEESPYRNMGGYRYSYRNCMMQCRLQNIVKLCNCTPFTYPFFDDYKVCGLIDLHCLSKHSSLFNNIVMNQQKGQYEDGSEGISCECQPTCENIVYRTDLSQGRFSKDNASSNVFPNYTLSDKTILHVYFKDLSSTRFRRDIIFSWNDLLASFGGIIGLFLGVSLLSIIETIYFFTIRLMLRGLPPRTKSTSARTSNKIAPFTWAP